ncbi:hypothetical protein FCO27_12265 [Bacillus pumilus]|nr:hypothetical protein FCO27_12265 [Bacillus pumilus]
MLLYAVLPLLYGESFIGRADIIGERKTGTLVVKNIWSENGMKQINNCNQLNSCFQKFEQMRQFWQSLRTDIPCMCIRIIKLRPLS